MQIHIGNKIEEAVRRKRIRVTDFAKKINCSRRNVYEIFKKKNIDTGLLVQISHELNENLFLNYINPSEMHVYQMDKYAQYYRKKLILNDHHIGNSTITKAKTINENIQELSILVNQLRNEVDRLRSFDE